MNKIAWDYVRPLKDETKIGVLESKHVFRLPDDLKNCIRENNGGIPYPCKFDARDHKGKVFGGLLSFNEGDVDNVYDALPLFESPDNRSLKMFPFGIDPAGNFLCVKDGAIVFYAHETSKDYKICESFSEFLNMLYD